jgi:twitching motility protein PilT
MPLSPELETLCAAAAEYQASDLLFHEGCPPQLRINGVLTALDFPALTPEFFAGLWEACAVAPDQLDADTSLTTAAGARFRVNLLHQLGRRAAVLRRIRSDIPDLETLGLPADLLREWVGRKAGIVLVCGPTGSGKSTTMAAVLEWMNGQFVRHVVTIEDPVEYIFRNRQCLFTQREVGIDTESFAEGLRRSLRQNPDVIFLGEIRDSLTAQTAIQAAETGHLVLATLHSATCSEAIERMQLFFPTGDQESIRRTLSAQLLGVLCQRLLPAAPSGLALATEFFTNFAATRKYIDEGRLNELQDLLARGDGKSAALFLRSLVALTKSGRITEETALAASDNPQELRRALRGISSSAQGGRR